MSIHRLLKRPIFRCLLFFTFLLLGPPISAFATDSPFHVAFQSDRLTIKADEVLLVKVLQEITRKVEIKVYGKAEVSEDRITVEFSDLTIQEGLAKILADYNVAYVYSPEKKGEYNPLPHKLTDVWVFSQRKEGNSSQKGPEERFNFADLSGKEMDGADSFSRQKVIESINESQDLSMIPVLLSFLHDPDYPVRISAIDALTNLGPLVSVDQIVETLRGQNDPQTRMAILTSGLELPRNVIVDHLLHDPSPQVRIGALQTLEGDTQIEELAREVLNDSEPSVQAAAKEILQTLEEDRNSQAGQEEEEEIQRDADSDIFE